MTGFVLVFALLVWLPWPAAVIIVSAALLLWAVGAALGELHVDRG